MHKIQNKLKLRWIIYNLKKHYFNIKVYSKRKTLNLILQSASLFLIGIISLLISILGTYKEYIFHTEGYFFNIFAIIISLIILVCGLYFLIFSLHIFQKIRKKTN